MKKTVLIFGVLAFAVVGLLQLSRYAVITGNLQTEWLLVFVAILFLGLGVFLQRRSLHQEKIVASEVNQDKIVELGLSKREYEVLLEMARGYSNKEIADHLFVSESTIKTHVSHVLEKLNAKRRTQAVQNAKELQILPF